VGVCLLVVRRAFGDRIPTVADYCREQDISDDTIRRAARVLLSPVVRLLRARRPGPKAAARPAASVRALRAINDLLHALLPSSMPKLLRSPVIRGLVVHQVVFWRDQGVPFEELTSFLGMSSKTLGRWIHRLETEGGGSEVPEHSRRPQTSPNQVPGEIQAALRSLGLLCRDYSIAEFTRLFNRRFATLLETYGLSSLSEKTVGKYFRGERSKTRAKPRTDSRRGCYEYPPPMTMAWIDTTQFKIAGVDVHIVVAMEAHSRMTLAGEACEQDNAEVAASVLGEALSRAPGLRALVRDRGKPYLNQCINALLAEQSCLPIDAHPYFPIDKAALERFFNTLKPWLRACLARLASEWQQADEPPWDQVLAAVRAALQVFLRAYNLIPQPYLEAKCPFERLEQSLRNIGVAEPDLARFHQLARERQDKDKLLEEIRGGLQLDVPLDRMRRDCVYFDKHALESAYNACFSKLVCPRDPSIKYPYRYLLAVARHKNRELLEDRSRSRRSEQQTERLLAEQRERTEHIRRENDDRAAHPENYLVSDLETWLRLQTKRGVRNPLLGSAALRETLKLSSRRLGTAFGATLRKLADTIPRLVDRLRPDADLASDQFVTRFLMFADAAVDDSRKPQPSPEGLAPPPADRGSCKHISNLVRQVLGRLQNPHDGRTYVPP